MAKTTPVGSVPEKVTLRPTAIGVHVIERLNRPGTEKSAFLRQLVELGYACQQAGFILDGTVLRHGGAVWEVQPQIPDTPLAQRVAGVEVSRTAPPQVEHPTRTADDPVSAAPGPRVQTAKSVEATSPSGGGIAERLRGLSG